jgi:hypothetical protein
VTSDIDIYRSANVLIKEHGQDARIITAMNADECLAKNDFDGEATWLRIVAAITWLQDSDRPNTDTNYQ